LSSPPYLFSFLEWIHSFFLYFFCPIPLKDSSPPGQWNYADWSGPTTSDLFNPPFDPTSPGTRLDPLSPVHSKQRRGLYLRPFWSNDSFSTSPELPPPYCIPDEVRRHRLISQGKKDVRPVFPPPLLFLLPPLERPRRERFHTSTPRLESDSLLSSSSVVFFLIFSSSDFSLLEPHCVPLLRRSNRDAQSEGDLPGGAT